MRTTSIAESSSTRPGRAGCAWSPRWTTSSTVPQGSPFSSESSDDVARVTATVRLEPGEKLRIVKFIAYAWSSQRSLPALRAQAAAALAEAKATGWDEICAEQRAYLDSFWAGADVVVEGRCRAAADAALRPVPAAAGERAGRAAGDPLEGPDRARLRRAHVLGRRVLRPAGAHLHRAGCRARRSPLATRDDRPRARARDDRSVCRAPRSRGARSAGRSAPGTGRRARPRSTSAPTSPTRRSATRP